MAASPQPRAAQVQRPAARAGWRVDRRRATRVAASRRITSSACRWSRPPRSTPVPPDTPYESVATLYPALNAARPGSVRVWPTAGRVPRHRHAARLLPRRRWRLPGAKARRRPDRSILWDDVEIGDGAVVERCIVTDGVSDSRRHDVVGPDPPPARRRARRQANAPSATWRYPHWTDGRDRRTTTDVRTRIDLFLSQCGLTQRGASVVALTRRRVRSPLLPGARAAGRLAGAGRASRRDRFRAARRSSTSPALLASMPVPVPRILAHSNELGIIALQDLGDVTLQAHLGAATPRRARRALSRGRRAHRHAAAPRGGAGQRRLRAVRHRVRRGQADLGAELLREALPRGVSRRDVHRRRPRGARRGVRGHRRGAGGRAARALPSRLSQPQPDAARRAALHHRLPGRAHGAGHLRPGVAAARLVRGSDRGAGRRADRVLPGAARPGRRPAPATASASATAST